MEEFIRLLGQQWWLIADQWMAAGDRDRALAAIEKCLDEQCAGAPVLAVSPSIRPLRGHPRYMAALKRMKLDVVDSR